ncbi:DUF6048 family protein [Reichenbachiella agarivorans]|uniref:DUF6048 family protein n=1 Tax=Reichenbachiella agarivorans TaxID=2979464 RepID=A0ABY6CXC9_9BACT|nr:DUF6048 family protein [Reichenbachiella agarivorans]UXP32895.1 DUF6048 family protein [Reichenbachiella agarivorans]
MKILKYITSLSLIVAVGQSAVAQVLEKREKDWKPSEIYLSADVVGLTRLLNGDVQNEFQGKIDFDVFYLAADWGRSNLSSKGEGFDYSSKGSFFRVGPQVNFTPYNKNRSSIYFGLMYAHASFSDQIDYAGVDQQWNQTNLSYSNEDLRANWLEATMGLNAKIIGPLYMGYVLRFKMAKVLTGDGTLAPYEIPGFGAASKNSVFGFNYYITYRFGLRDKPIPIRPKIVKKRVEEEE